MPYSTANGVNTYYEEHGSGEPVLLLHGGFSSGEDCFGSMAAALAPKYRVIVPDRRGHGRTADVEGPITYDGMADDTLSFMDALGIDSAMVVGYSDGGNVGLIMAMRQAARVRKLVAISANYRPDAVAGEMREGLRHMQADEFIPPIVEAYKAVSPNGAEHWPVFFDKVRRMILEEPTFALEELGKITGPTMIMAADDDMITLDGTIEQYRAIPGARLCIVPNATHLLVFEQPDRVNGIVADFLASEGPPPSMF